MERNRFIDVLKGILIINVIILHFPYVDPEIQKYLFPFTLAMTVPCFMMISGYVSGLSFAKRRINSLEAAYSPMLIAEKMVRFVVPFTMAFIAEWILFRLHGIYQVDIKTYGILALGMDYLRGAIGPGNYYFPIMIQFIFLIPVIYYIIKKNQLKGLFYCFVINAVYEVVQHAYLLNYETYRLLIFRYLFIIAAGCYFAIHPVKPSRKYVVVGAACMTIGIAFICLFSFTSYAPKIITYWNTTSFVTMLYIIPILGWMLTNVKIKCRPLEIVGRASFNIFLVQMIFYSLRGAVYESVQECWAKLCISIGVCVGIGILFYYIEQPITKWIIKKFQLKTY